MYIVILAIYILAVAGIVAICNKVFGESNDVSEYVELGSIVVGFFVFVSLGIVPQGEISYCTATQIKTYQPHAILRNDSGTYYIIKSKYADKQEIPVKFVSDMSVVPTVVKNHYKQKNKLLDWLVFDFDAEELILPSDYQVETIFE